MPDDLPGPGPGPVLLAVLWAAAAGVGVVLAPVGLLVALALGVVAGLIGVAVVLAPSAHGPDHPPDSTDDPADHPTTGPAQPEIGRRELSARARAVGPGRGGPRIRDELAGRRYGRHRLRNSRRPAAGPVGPRRRVARLAALAARERKPLLDTSAQHPPDLGGSGEIGPHEWAFGTRRSRGWG